MCHVQEDELGPVAGARLGAHRQRAGSARRSQGRRGSGRDPAGGGGRSGSGQGGGGEQEALSVRHDRGPAQPALPEGQRLQDRQEPRGQGSVRQGPLPGDQGDGAGAPRPDPRDRRGQAPGHPDGAGGLTHRVKDRSGRDSTYRGFPVLTQRGDEFAP